MRKERIARDHDIRTRHCHSCQRRAEYFEEMIQLIAVLIVEHRKARQWRAFVPVERRRYSPYAATPVAELHLFFFGILDQPVWWVRHDRMN
jgi:hypothetical protein